MLRWFVIGVLSTCVCWPQQAPSPNKLPIKRIVLYKNGVGYFEHLGPVRDNQDVSITFTSGQLNDVLKSLTVLDLNGGQITGVGYGSSAPLERQRGDLRLPLGEKTSLTEFLEAVRGARIEVKSGTAAITGRLLSVERKTRISGGNSLEIDYVSVMTDSGEVRTTELSPAFSVRLLDKALVDKVSRYLDLASASRDADVRRMVVSTTGAGERSVFLSYISEVPIWKATYRVVLDGKKSGKPLLQGWAIVDNTVGQDWDNVQLSLVAGAPQSFVQNLSQPYYAKRPVIGLPDTASGQPQTFESTLFSGGAVIAGVATDRSGALVVGATVRAYDSTGTLVGEATTNSSGRYHLSVLDGDVRMEVTSNGFNTASISGLQATSGSPIQRDVTLQVGSVAQTVEVNASVASLQTTSASLSSTGRSLGSGAGLGGGNMGYNKKIPPAQPSSYTSADVEMARARMQSSASAHDLGDLFEYKIKEPITIERNRSALVPILQAPISAEKVSVWNERMTSARPQRALWLTNSTGLTLDGGSFSVLEQETFAGEGIFDPIRPDEKRLVSYAVDLAVNVSAKNTSERQRVSRVKITKGVMTQKSEIREVKTYSFRNEDTSDRAIIVEHPVRNGYELRGAAKPAETTADWMRFRVSVKSKQTESLVVEEARVLGSTFMISNLTSDELVLWGKEKMITPAIAAALQGVLAQKSAINELESRKSGLEDETARIFDDQQRLRENLKALKGSAEEKALIQRYTTQLNQQETRLDALKTEMKMLETQIDSAQAALDKTIQNLQFDDRI